MDDSNSKCTLGLLLNDSECHKVIYSRSTGLRKLSELKDGEKQLILVRSSLKDNSEINDASTICLHHIKILLEKYEFLQKTCFDPFKRHKSVVKHGLRNIDMHDAEILNTVTDGTIKPGMKLCASCRKKENWNTEIDVDHQEISDSDESFVPDNISEAAINTSVTSLGCSPFKIAKVHTNKRLTYCRNKVSKAEDALRKQVGKRLNVEPATFSLTKEPCNKCSDLEKMVQAMKDKCSVSATQQQIQILTMAPPSWTLERVAHEFGVTKYMAKTARDLKAVGGVFAMPRPKCGKRLPQLVTNMIADFFEDDEVSRLCPGQKDYVTVTIEGQRIQKQKRLLLANLTELYQMFKNKTSNQYKVGISKFCELRPRWCITVGAKGAHSVCVCQIHQNAKLLVAPLKLDYKELLSILVCSVDSRDCMLHGCANCPGQNALKSHLQAKLVAELGMDMDDEIEFKQWQHTDRTTLITRRETVSNFIELLCAQYEKLAAHHFVAKAQAAYMSSTKETLSENTALVLLDFSENYSFLVQDAVQGFHWENSQATLHPFAVYYKAKSNNEVSCMCLCVISDCMQHNAVTVHAFLTLIIPYIKSQLPSVSLIKYFSDGAVSQYKNCKNFQNLLFHKHDFEINAEWHFFATSHGKSACDGIGGTVKRLASRASLQQITDHFILTPSDLYQWASSHIPGIKFFYMSNGQVSKHEELIQCRLADVKTVQGTRSHHCFIPVKDTLKIARLSTDLHFTTVTLQTTIVKSSLQSGQYVAAMYDKEWYIGVVVQTSSDYDDILINFVMPKGPATSFSWGNKTDECWVPINNVICTIPAPRTTGSGRIYSIENETLNKITSCLLKI